MGSRASIPFIDYKLIYLFHLGNCSSVVGCNRERIKLIVPQFDAPPLLFLWLVLRNQWAATSLSPMVWNVRTAKTELMIRRVQFLRREQKKLPLRQRALEMTEDIIQNMVIQGSMTRKILYVSII